MLAKSTNVVSWSGNFIQAISACHQVSDRMILGQFPVSTLASIVLLPVGSEPSSSAIETGTSKFICCNKAIKNAPISFDNDILVIFI